MQPIFPLIVTLCFVLARSSDLKVGDAGFTLGLQGSSWRYHCGATLVSFHNFQFGLTSARCIVEGNMTAVAGHVTSGQEKLFRRVNNVVIQPGVGQIALLCFIPFETDETIFPVGLPEQSETLPKGNLTLFQFVDRDKIQIIVDSNQKVVSSSLCTENFNHTENTFCALSDSEMGRIKYFGGPAMNDKGVLTGVLLETFVSSNSTATNPYLFMHVGHYVDWIKATVEAYKYSDGRPPDCSSPGVKKSPSGFGKTNIEGRNYLKIINTKYYLWFGFFSIFGLLISKTCHG